MSDEYTQQKCDGLFPIDRFSPAIQEMCQLPHRLPGSFYDETEPVDYTKRFSIGDDDIPALLEIACWIDRCEDSALADYWDAPLNAWEALGQLDPMRVVPGLLEILNHINWDEADLFMLELAGFLAYSVKRSAAESLESGDTSRNAVSLVLDAMKEKDRHSGTRMVLSDALNEIVVAYPEYRAAYERILLDELKELRTDCRDWYATCVCDLAFRENPPPETVALLEKICREGYAETMRYWDNDGMIEIAGFDYENDPQLLELHEKSRKTSKILGAFYNCGRTFPRQAMLDARELRDWIVPNLIEVVRNATAYAKFGVPTSDGTVQFAVHLLAEFRATEALPAIFDSLSLTDDQAWDHLYGEGLYESMPGILNRLIGDDVADYDPKLRDPETPELLQCILLKAMTWLVARKTLSKEDYDKLLREYMEIAIRAEKPGLVTDLVCDMLDTENPEHLPIIRDAFEKDLVDDERVSREEADPDFIAKFGHGLSFWDRLPKPDYDFSDAIEELESWAWFQSPPEPKPSPRPIHLSDRGTGNILHLSSKPLPLPMSPSDSHARPAEPMRAAPKIGRNEPCPCGSGKKYKKCCME